MHGQTDTPVQPVEALPMGGYDSNDLWTTEGMVHWWNSDLVGQDLGLNSRNLLLDKIYS